MFLKKTFLALPLAAALVAAGCGGGDSSETKPSAKARSKARAGNEVTVKAFNFEPDPIRIRAGQTVVWTNEDSTVHTVTTGARGKRDGLLDERLRASGGSVRHRFSRAGRYRYHCALHSGPGMEGHVIVE